MADAETARLCSQIVQSHFGTLTATVASTLLQHGRLTISQVTRLSQLNLKKARVALVILIQHNLIWHFESDDEGETVEFIVDECIARTRFGRYVHLVDRLLHREAADIIQILLDHGKLRRADVLRHLAIDDPSISRYKASFAELADAGYIRVVTKIAQLSPRDRLLKYEREERAELLGIPTSKQIREAHERASEKVRKEDEFALQSTPISTDPLSVFFDIWSLSHVPYDAEDSCGHIAGREAYAPLFAPSLTVRQDDSFFRVNYNQLNVHLRNEVFVEHARERYNDGAACVLEAILNTIGRKVADLTTECSEAITLNTVIACVQNLDHLNNGLSTKSTKTAPSVSPIKEYARWLAAADNPSPNGRLGRFISLSGGPSGVGKVVVEFRVICERLRIRLLESIVRDRHGDDAVRIFRILLASGKMDEKHLAKVAMMSHKEIRPLLSTLSDESFVSLQEVAKSNDRNPSRTFYLWFVDPHKASFVVLRNLYKSIFNVMSRQHFEANDSLVRSVLEKCSRVDVSKDITLLHPTEQEILSSWEAKRDKLHILQCRIEEAVFVLRDMMLAYDSQ